MANRDHYRTAGDDYSSGQSQLIKSDDSSSQGSNQYQDGMDRLTDRTQNSSVYDIKGQATNFLHQTGEQVKNIAQGAADAVKSTLGMNTGDHNATSHGSSTTHQSNDSSYQSNPSNRA